MLPEFIRGYFPSPRIIDRDVAGMGLSGELAAFHVAVLKGFSEAYQLYAKWMAGPPVGLLAPLEHSKADSAGLIDWCAVLGADCMANIKSHVAPCYHGLQEGWRANMIHGRRSARLPVVARFGVVYEDSAHAAAVKLASGITLRFDGWDIEWLRSQDLRRLVSSTTHLLLDVGVFDAGELCAELRAEAVATDILIRRGLSLIGDPQATNGDFPADQPLRVARGAATGLPPVADGHDGDEFPASHFKSVFGIPAERITKARRDGRLVGAKRGKKWFYRLKDVKFLWPEDIE